MLSKHTHLGLTLIALAFWLWFSTQISSAAPLEQGGTLYLPLVAGSGTVTTTPALSPFETMLNQARQVCANLAINQACLGNGVAEDFAQVGDTLSLTNGMTLAIRSTLPTVAKETMVVMRILAPSVAEISETVGITQMVEVVVVGNVDLSIIQLITHTSVMTEMPTLRFASQPVISGSEQAKSGLVVINPTHEELLTLGVNGAVITLGSTAFVQAEPGKEMGVAMRQGSALVEASGGSSAVVAGTQVKMTLDAAGMVNAAPREAELSEEDVPTPENTYHDLSTKLFRSLVECRHTQNPRRVYQVYYYIRLLRTPAMRTLGGEDTINTHAPLVERCARFEVIFDSDVRYIHPLIPQRDHVHSDGAFIQFDINGNLVARAASSLRHLQVETYTPPGCTLQSLTKPNGEFSVEQASLRIHYNTMNITTWTRPSIRFEQLPVAHILCPFNPHSEMQIHVEWPFRFYTLHPELALPAEQVYQLQEAHWKYTGRQIFAEAIFAGRNAPLLNGMIHGDSYFVLRHAPITE